ncbi:acetyl-CoA carboxylase biotin carboxylase subunit family protein [Pseudomonas sp. nanlin1]|uniref:ATP-grasp domain-containing protein n=1 Tax=Pseudomonas sp. nanlin1 TaxID=3040605 RepID=UPI003890CF4D
MRAMAPALLIIDYNLSRVGDVAHLREYARRAYGLQTWLIRHHPSAHDLAMCDQVFDLDPLALDFVEQACQALGQQASCIRAGLVFSDNAVASGARLLERLGLLVDDAALAAGAFDKYQYRCSETARQAELAGTGLMLPAYVAVRSIDDLLGFAQGQPQGFVVKPMCEGNNRGVVRVEPGTDVRSAFAEVAHFVPQGVIAEQVIPYAREYSWDGLGELAFITEKVSASGRYPVEVAQILPARLNALERETLSRAGGQINRLIGQRHGPFHNEIKLSDDGTRAAAVEPNRRPAGMKIWTLARWVYGVDLYRAWVDSLMGQALPTTLGTPRCAAATVMLGVPEDQVFTAFAQEPQVLLAALLATASCHHLAPDELEAHHFTWLDPKPRLIHRIARDNNDFAAQVCIVLRNPAADIHAVVNTLRGQWLTALQAAPKSLKAS